MRLSNNAAGSDDEKERLPLLQQQPSSSCTDCRGDGGADASGSVVVTVPADCAAALEPPVPHGSPSASRTQQAKSRRRATATSSSDSTEAVSGAWEEPRTCRICFETEEDPNDGDPDNPLISPCLCSGSSRFVHRQCLASWRTAAHRADAFYECEVCKFKYQYSRAWWASLLGSRVTQLAVFAALLSLLVAGLGNVPIVTSPKPDSPSPVGLHILNGLAMLGILGILASLVLGVLRAVGAVSLMWMPEPWCPAALCLDCQGGGLPLCMELSAGGAECGALFAILLLAAGVAASAALVWQLLLLASRTALSKAQRMVENVQGEGADSSHKETT